MVVRVEVTGVAALPILGKVFLAIALGLLLGGGGLAMVERFAGRDAVTDGVVVEAGRQPRVRFNAANGDVVTFRSSVHADFREVGERLPVAYAPEPPHSAVINTLMIRWLVPIILGILGGVFMCLGASFSLAGWLFAPR